MLKRIEKKKQPNHPYHVNGDNHIATQTMAFCHHQ
jgi:hypothetical protein